MFFKILHHIRKKPPHVRSAIALTVSATFTLLVAVIWAFSFAEYISETTKNGLKEKTLEPVNKISSIFSEGIGNILELKNIFKNDLENLKPTSTPLLFNDTAATTTVSEQDSASSTSTEELIQ